MHELTNSRNAHPGPPAKATITCPNCDTDLTRPRSIVDPWTAYGEDFGHIEGPRL